jgi:hypothetical protein
LQLAAEVIASFLAKDPFAEGALQTRAPAHHFDVILMQGATISLGLFDVTMGDLVVG